jgi:hypothetical protein
MFIKTIKTPSKINKLESDILNSQDSKAYLFGVVLTTIGENNKIPVILKWSTYSEACLEIEKVVMLHKDGKFELDATMIKFAFAILNRIMNVAAGVNLNENEQKVFHKSARSRGIAGRI